jgi:hypothetical protein
MNETCRHLELDSWPTRAPARFWWKLLLLEALQRSFPAVFCCLVDHNVALSAHNLAENAQATPLSPKCSEIP